MTLLTAILTSFPTEAITPVLVQVVNVLVSNGQDGGVMSKQAMLEQMAHRFSPPVLLPVILTRLNQPNLLSSTNALLLFAVHKVISSHRDTLATWTSWLEKSDFIRLIVKARSVILYLLTGSFLRTRIRTYRMRHETVWQNSARSGTTTCASTWNPSSTP
jgi:hypothetical protein